MKFNPSEMCQRGFAYAIVDEVDSILIDEARTPLIISGPASGEANRWFTEFAKIATTLEAGVDYEVDEKKRTVGVLEPGIEKVEDYLGIDNLYESANTPLISFLNNAIRAKALFRKDKDYVVMNGEVLIVDEHTGRILAGRRYSEGMHQAVEAKEGVAIQAENQTLASITFQNYFRLYAKLAGMTGTAVASPSSACSPSPSRRRSAPTGSVRTGPFGVWRCRSAGGKHSSAARAGWSLANGSPAMIAAKTFESPCSDLKRSTSILAQRDSAACGEHSTISDRDRVSASSISMLRSCAAARSSRSRKIGRRRSGTMPRGVTRPTRSRGMRYDSRKLWRRAAARRSRWL